MRPALAITAALVLASCTPPGGNPPLTPAEQVKVQETRALGAANATFTVAETLLTKLIVGKVVTGKTEDDLVALAQKVRNALDLGDAVQAQTLAEQLQTAVNEIAKKAGVK